MNATFNKFGAGFAVAAFFTAAANGTIIHDTTFLLLPLGASLIWMLRKTGMVQAMNKKILWLGLFSTGLVFVSAATPSPPPFLNGSLGAVELGTNGSTFNATSLTLDSDNNLIRSTETGDFLIQVPAKSDLTAYSLTLGGINPTATAENIPNFFIFSSPDPDFGTPGTTPVDRFEFTLLSIQSSVSGIFTGTGTIIDTTGAFAPTAANFTVSFSSAPDAPLAVGDYSLTVNALGVPEPTTISLFATGLLGAWAMHRRKKIVR